MPDDHMTAESTAMKSRAAEARARAAPMITWLMNEERVTPVRIPLLFDRFICRLIKAGLPIIRASLHIRQLHPQLAARSLIWILGGGGTIELDHEHSIQSLGVYLASPVKAINDGSGPIRRCLESPDCPLDFPLLKELQNLGLTDYAMHPLHFSGGSINALSIATNEAGGFNESDIAFLDATLAAFSAIVELQQLRRTARDLLSTYVGPNTGERIFSGEIKRGDGEVIHAVIWYCDLRGFTELSETQPLGEVLAVLDDYFDQVAQAVVAHDGEILKFVGDAMLAIFPCEASGAALCQSCDGAVAAAEAAVAGVAELNQMQTGEGRLPVHCGVAVHIGEVMYGNIGAADRLDFTVIGPAVNLVNRLQQLCAQLDESIVVSAEIVASSTRDFRSLGHHELKGIAKPREAFTLV